MSQVSRAKCTFRARVCFSFIFWHIQIANCKKKKQRQLLKKNTALEKYQKIICNEQLLFHFHYECKKKFWTWNTYAKITLKMLHWKHWESD